MTASPSQAVDSVPELAFVIPAFEAAASVGAVVKELHVAWSTAGQHGSPRILVVDDGSTDDTGEVATAAGALLLTHDQNKGKGAALQTALSWARESKLDAIVTLDADGQHPPAEAVRLALLRPELTASTLVLAVRDLKAAGAPRPNQRSNAFSNSVLSLFGGQRLLDTQCGLRRYPVAPTLALLARDAGFAFEADVVLRAARRGLPILHVPFHVVYPPEKDRVTHFDAVRDPARIVRRVVTTALTVPHHRFLRRLGRRLLIAALLIIALGVVSHIAIRRLCAIEPPRITTPSITRQDRGTLRLAGRSSAVFRQGIWEVALHGTPEEIGFSHSLLLRDRMLANEGVLFGALKKYVPTRAFRLLLLDTAVLGYRNVDQGMSSPRLREIAAGALAFSPDPYADLFPTFQRFVYLNSLYDISLSFEYSPLIGCTTFTVSGERSTQGPLLARAFDFEVDDIFDDDKAVFFVHEEGKLPFASVAWPGLVGVVSGMNAAGVGVVVHGARAGDTSVDGEPVVHGLRRVLLHAHSTEEAIQLLNDRPAMVSHIVVLQDASGDAVVVERAVGRTGHVRRLPEIAATTNHLEGPLKDDPKNLRVLSGTSTSQRRARGDALTSQAKGHVSPKTLVDWLRDRKAVDGSPLEPGDRNAIDALIATHGVVMDTRSRILWVSRSPHLLGEFVRYDLDEVFATSPLPAARTTRPTLPADPERVRLDALPANASF